MRVVAIVLGVIIALLFCMWMGVMGESFLQHSYYENYI